MRLASVGQAVFAAVMIALGVLGLIKGNFAPVWDPVPKWVPAREVLVYLSVFVSLASGLGLLWPRTAAPAARVLLASLLLWWLLFRLPDTFPAPAVLGSWYGCAETGGMLAGAWVLYAWFATERERRRIGFATGDNGVRIARALYGLTQIFFGLGQLAYFQPTVVLVPAWLPWPVFWAYFTSWTFIAAGVAVLIGVRARLAAALSAWQMGLFIPLIWLPMLAAGKISDFRWGEFVVTCALTASAWVVTDSYRDRPAARTPGIQPVVDGKSAQDPSH